jgi:hypothetical protein
VFQFERITFVHYQLNHYYKTPFFQPTYLWLDIIFDYVSIVIFWIFKYIMHNCQVNWVAYSLGGQMKANSNYFGAHGIFFSTHMVYNSILVETLTLKITHSTIKPPRVVCQLRKSHVQLFWSITKHNDAW